MTSLRRLAFPALILSAVLILFPLLELAQAIWPLRPGEMPWRVLSVGLFSRMLVTPLLGLAFAYGAALLLERRGLLRALSVFTGLLAVLLLLGLAFYALDVLELRAQISDTSADYDLGILLSFVKYGVSLLFLLTLARSTWRAATAVDRERRQIAAPASLVLGRMKNSAKPAAVARPAVNGGNRVQAPAGPTPANPDHVIAASPRAREPS